MRKMHDWGGDVETEDLAVLRETVRQGSISRAARSLSMSQPTVSRRIMRLERELGCTLLDRHSPSLSPTREGLAVVRFAEAVAAEERRLREELARGVPLQGEIDIAASTTPAERIVPELLARFAREHPHVQARLHVMDSQVVETSIVERHCDVGFMGLAPSPGLLSAVPVAEDELSLAVPSTHPLAAREEVDAGELLGLAFVERDAGSATRTFVEETLRATGLPFECRHVVAEVSSPHSLLAAVRSGHGVGFVSTALLPVAGVKALRVKGVRLARSLYLVFLKEGLTPVAEAFARTAGVPVDQAPRHGARADP